MKRRLWLIGGTQESRWLVKQLHHQISPGAIADLALLITVTTEAARRLYPDGLASHIWVGQLAPGQANDFVTSQGIGGILDLSHPFATQISQQAIAIAQRHSFPYLRYERARVSSPTTAWRDHQGRPGFVSLSQVSDLFTADYLCHERTLLTLGYRLLASFAPWQPQGTLFARILPSLAALQAAEAAGFTSDRVIALRPPISPGLETALWQQWQITQVVTKASGTAGGQNHKQAIAAALGIRLIQIERPAIVYPRQTDHLDTALEFALRYLTEGME